MRILRAVLLLAAGLSSGACFQFSTVLTVKADGSGTIRQHLLFTNAALAQIRQFAALGGGSLQNFDPMSEQQARDAAADLGPGVTYVTSTPLKTDLGQGRDITYAFTDINQLRLTAEPPAPGGLSVSAPTITSATAVSFNLARQPDGHSLLKVIVPQLPIVPGSAGTPTLGDLPSTDQLAMIRPMFAGAKLSVAVEPGGPLVRTSSPYVDGQRVTLLEVDVDSLFKDETLFGRLQAAKSPDEVKTILTGVPGLKVNLDPEITIEFQ